MKRIKTTASLALAAMIGGAAGSAGAAPAKSVQNVVFILADDLGIQDLGCYGSTYYETPNCDRFAAEGVRFLNAYSAHPVCSPTRASILTGRYPARLHLTAYIPGKECPYAKLSSPDWIKYLRDSETTYAEAFRDAGYATGHIGKWHVGARKNAAMHGFDFVIERPPVDTTDLSDPWFIEYYTRETEQFMEKNREHPFFITLSHGTVHVPLYEREDRIEKYRRKAPGANGQNNPVMAAMVERMDWSVGRVLAKIKELGLEDRTAVVFFSDNGGLSQVYDPVQKKTVIATSNLPYRGGKSQLYEGGIRVPLMIRWPGVTSAGSTCDVPVVSTDLYPTFLSMTGLPPRPEQCLDGLSLSPLLRGGQQLNRPALYWHYPHYQTLPPHGAVRCGDWKLIEHYEDGKLELFDLSDDVGEQHNLAAQRPERARELRKMLRNHLEAIGAQMPVPNSGYDPSVHRGKDSVNGEYDDYELKQDEDPRQYITDPRLDYGANCTSAAAAPVGKSLPVTGFAASGSEAVACSVVAHRGFSHVAPENTLASVRQAIEVGATGCEFDVYRCRSGELVLFHDKELERTTDGFGQIVETDFDELRKLDAGSWKNPAYCGERIPELREALQLLKDSGCRAVVEVKMNGITDQVLKTIEEEAMSDQVTVIAFSQKVISEVRKQAPDLSCAWLYGDNTLEGSAEQKADLIAEKARACNALAVNLNQEMLDEALIAALHDRGLSVWTWTVDDPDRIRRLLAWGVAVLTTNRPDLALSVCTAAE